MNHYTALRQTFVKADPRYGPVPFWWWSAEKVTEERIRWQLEKFRKGGMRNIGIINLAPTGPQYGSVGDNPAYMSEEWWRMFEVTLREAERLGMYLWFYDQIGFSGSNFPARIVSQYPEFSGYQLRRFTYDQGIPNQAELLLETKEYVYAAVRQGFNWLDPQANKRLIDSVHGEMERRFPLDLGNTIAGSFQDELPPLPLWTPELSVMYQSRYKGAFIEALPALFDDVPDAALYRRRVYGLAAELAEQAFFRPLAEWHNKHNMLIGCDQAGPARRVDVHGAQRLYLDYFRTHRNYNSPGCDMDGEPKPHSSMVHVHGGKRVWLEAFHSSGWGGTLEETMHWLVPWFQAGITLYSPHAVYYSTRGGWWEWAPPDTGWRQPYYEHYPVFADTVSRVCSLLSAGTHRCDVAVHYPAYAVIGHMSLSDGKPQEHPMAVSSRDPDEYTTRIQRVYQSLAGNWTRRLTANSGALPAKRRDFDVVDDTALQKAVPSQAGLQIGDECFSVLLLCGTTIMEEQARANVDRWIEQGGLVIAVQVDSDEPQIPGVVYIDSAEQAVALIEEKYPPVITGPGMTLSRKVDDADIYLLLPAESELLRMHKPAGPDMAKPHDAAYRLRTQGSPQLWDPVSGTIRNIPFNRQGEWVEIHVSFTDWPAALIVCPYTDDALSEDHLSLDEFSGTGNDRDSFTPFAANPGQRHGIPDEPVWSTDQWRIRVVPTLDNRYGDFDLHHADRGLVPIERRIMQCRQEESLGQGLREDWQHPAYDDTHWDSRLWSESAYWSVCEDESFAETKTKPVVYSTIFGDLATRTWAGRMGHVPRRFLNLGAREQGAGAWARTTVVAPCDGRYWIRTESNARIQGWINDCEIEWTGGPEEQTAWIDLREGGNLLKLRATARENGGIRIGVEINAEARAALPKWIYANSPNPQTALTRQITIDQGDEVQSMRIVFAARGRVALYINGSKVTEHGDFNPYIRQGQEEVDVTALCRPGMNELCLKLPEGEGEAFLDGIVETKEGEKVSFCSGIDWQDEQGNEARILHSAVLQFAETETLWIAERPHPLADVGWLMPGSVPASKPLPFVADPARIGHPVWLRFPLPVGSRALEVEAVGTTTLWIDGEEVAIKQSRAEFAPQHAGAVAAIRVETAEPYLEADVLRLPVKIETVPHEGNLGDWRTALSLPHHSGAVDYESVLETDGVSEATLHLGHVRGTAEVWIDGRPLGVRLWTPYSFDLGNLLRPGKHRLRIRITNTLGTHYEIGRPTGNVGGDKEIAYWNKEMLPEWPDLFASGGLYGPVQITGKREGSGHTE